MLDERLLMPKPADVELCKVLTREAEIRGREGFRLSAMVEELEQRGQPEAADAVREVAHLNEMERLRLRAEIMALGC